MVGKAAPSLCEEGTRMIRTFRKNVVWISQGAVSLITTRSRQLQGVCLPIRTSAWGRGTLEPRQLLPRKGRTGQWRVAVSTVGKSYIKVPGNLGLA